MTARIRFQAMAANVARELQAGGADAYGRPAERRTADGSTRVPCRHCLTDVPVSEEYLVLAYRPFDGLQPYAETGPVFLHAAACARHPESSDTPAMLLKSRHMLLRGYSADQRIVYGSGAMVPTSEISAVATALLDRPDVAFVDVRSGTNNCFQCRIDRVEP